jgi:methyl-accepting chemotaxis protein-like sensor
VNADQDGGLRRWGREVDALSAEATRHNTRLEAGLERARQAVDEVLARLEGLEARLDPSPALVQRVAEVAHVTGEAATRTDLLALNFQVEAARLGEDDRGLAQVAYEIRSLAERGARGAAELQELASGLERAGAAASEACAEGRTSLESAREVLREAHRSGSRMGESLSLARSAAASFAAGTKHRADAGEAAGEAARRLGAAASVREEAIRRLAETSAARLWQTLRDLREEGRRSEGAVEQVESFSSKLRGLFGLVSDADEIARRAKQLALNADLAAHRSEDPAFGLFAEEARRLAEQAEVTASASQARLVEAQELIGPDLADRRARVLTLQRIASELDRVLRGFGGTGDQVADQSELEQVWREDRATARDLADARASYQALVDEASGEQPPLET